MDLNLNVSLMPQNAFKPISFLLKDPYLMHLKANERAFSELSTMVRRKGKTCSSLA